ncbi:MAG: aminodeoxychorismate synthase component I [Anaerolineales bacterium]|nr:aminodeoxychorismate synthase component I [Anaerolineales bacterium]
MSVTALLHDAAGNRWLSFGEPRACFSTRRLDEVLPLLRCAESEVERGAYLAGFISYEAAPAFDPALAAHPPGEFPLIWLGVFDAAQVQPLPELPPFSGAFQLGEWQATVSEAEYAEAIARIKAEIAAGRTYQVNYTYRLRAPFSGEPRALFAQLADAQRAAYSAYVDIGRFVLCSASPELFFERTGRTVRAKPMKGTAARGRTLAEDEAQARRLHHDPKNRAENVMIVDMLRNDLGRVAETGSVRVPALFETERYPTVWQMTSTVIAETRASLAQLLAALFPCASVTGAPKRSTMHIIRALEATPRRAYCGAIGFVLPEGRAQFNVAIRTVLIDRALGQAEYGVGSGVVWDSNAADEWAECQVKSRVLRARLPAFALLESLRWEPATSYFLLDRHLRRLRDSAVYFGFALDEAAVCARLEALAQTLPPIPHKVRLRVERDGGLHVEAAPLNDAGNEPVRLALAPRPVNSSNIFLFHKTTHRQMYDEARAARPEADDVVLWNERGELTEACLANLAVKLDGEWWTPPMEAGLLPGVYRAELLETGYLRERVLSPDDLQRAEALAVLNSVRLWRAATFTTD